MRWMFLIIGLLASCAAVQMRADTPKPAQAAAQHSESVTANASLDDYAVHLVRLITLTQKCAKGRDKASCDPQSIGQDDLVQWNAEQRIIRYDWLRALFLRAQEPDKAQQAAGALGKAEMSNDSTLPTPKTTTQLHEDAEARLTRDLAQAGAPVETLPAHTAESDAMRQVLDGKEFRKLQQHSPQDSAFEKAGEWLNKVFMGISSLTQGASWLGRALVWGFVLAVGVGLVWALLQLERRWRVRLVPDVEAPAPGAASARDWQLWLADAHKAAGASLWREAIHFLYWAAISRLESKRLWPADRARTPREYLALVAPEDPRKAGLAALTGSFERVWYGGRPAGQTDYQRADELASALIGTGATEGGQAR